MSEARCRKIFLAISLIGLTIGSHMVFAQTIEKQNTVPVAEKIIFIKGTWEQVAALAKKNSKYIFVDTYTAWCAPCRQLKNVTFKDRDAAAFFNENFINYTVDMEKGEGVELGEKWDITEYPTLLFFTPEGKMVMKQIGYLDGKQLIEIGRQALAKANH